jgi:SAM-dependent methyltransferase/uncharacterized membrane protein YbhN (UPF0104 family)
MPDQAATAATIEYEGAPDTPGEAQARWRMVWLAAVPVALLLACLAFGKYAPLRAVRAAFSTLSPKSVALAAALVLGQLGLQVVRLYALVPSRWGIGLRRVAQVLSVGQLINALAPARGGDVVKVVALERASRETTGSLAGAAGVLAAEKVADFAPLLILLAVTGFPWLERPGVDGLRIAEIGGAVVGAICLLLVAARRLSRRAFAAIASSSQRFLGGLSAFRRPGTALTALGAGFACWLIEAAALSTLCAGAGASLSLQHAMWVLMLLNVGIAVPIAPANIGTFEAALAFGLHRAGVSDALAVAVALAHHGIQLGSVALWTAGTSALARKSSPFRVTEKDKARALHHYASVATHYDEVAGRGPLARLRLREHAAVLRLSAFQTPGQSMVDVGCGGGFYAREAKRAGLVVWAVDAIPEMVQRIAPLVDGVAVADLETLSLSREFDRVVCAGVLDFVLDPEKAFANLCAHVSADGRVVLLVPRTGPGGVWYRFEKAMIRVRVNLYSLRWFEEMGAASGFEVTAVAYPLFHNMVVCLERRRTPVTLRAAVG